MTPPLLQIAPLGDRGLLVQLGTSIDEPTFHRVQSAAAVLEPLRAEGVTDIVPGFTTIAVHYEPMRIAAQHGELPHTTIASRVHSLLYQLDAEPVYESRVVEIPVVYGGAGGPDLDDVARAHDLSTDEIIAIHAGGEYIVYMVGFMPGFAYLGGLDPRIATPRRPVPRSAVPAGSVAIGGAQTGVYPLTSPGGWHLIGKTSVALFTPETGALLRAGDRVRFRAVEVMSAANTTSASIVESRG